MTTTDNYALAVEEAITWQGLRPIMEALTAERIHFTVEQTGGFFMVGFTECANGALITWNAESVGIYASSWDYSQDAEPLREVFELNPATVAQTVTAWTQEEHMTTDADVVALWHDMDADTYARDFHLRGETAHRVGESWSFRDSIRSTYGDDIPSAQDYADTIATQYADMFPEDYA